MQMLVDIHVHLADSRFVDPGEIIRSAATADVGWLLGTAAGSEDWEPLIALAGRFPICHCALGVHPWYATHWTPGVARRLRCLARQTRLTAIGEIGLDFGGHRPGRDCQLRCFEEQLTIAGEVGKPVILHVHKSWPATRRLLTDISPRPAGIVWHGFTRGPELAEEALDLGLYLSFGGAVTDARNHRCRSAAASIPGDRLLIESDGPNQPVRRVRDARSNPVSCPAHVVDIYAAVAALRGVSVPDLAVSVARNAEKLFTAGRGVC